MSNSINKTSLSHHENNLEEPLEGACNESSDKKELVLKFSQAKPFVDTSRPGDYSDANYLTNEKPQLWFDDVSPTSSNNILSEDENVPGAPPKKPETSFTTIKNLVI